MPKKLSNLDVEDYIKTQNCEWVSGKYYNNQSKINIRFECGCVSSISFCNFKNGRRCKFHSNERAKNARKTHLNKIIEDVESHNFVFIKRVSGDGRKSLIKYSCSEGHITERYYKDFINHPNCSVCMKIRTNLSYRNSEDKIKSVINKMGCSLIEIVFYNNMKDSLLKIEFTCFHTEEISFGNFYSRKSGLCVECEMERRKGETSYGWKGGVTPLTDYIRKNLKDWNNYCSKYYNYRCVVTNLPMDHIHHLQSFNLILSETLTELNFKSKGSVKDYSQEELSLVLEKFIEVQSRYPIGVPLISDVHNLFHKLYGRGNNTPDQFYEFIDRIESGEITINK